MYQVQGYTFETKEQERLAAHEVETIQYIRSHTRMDDPDVVLALYNKLVLKEIFVTPVGFDFLRKLQEYLYTIPYIKREDVLPIPVFQPQNNVSGTQKQSVQKKQKVQKTQPQKEKIQKEKQKQKVVDRHRRETNRDYRKLFHISTFFAVVFAIVIIGMFAITWLSKDSVTIFNYENKIVDKYESWEKQLDKREAELDKREEKLTEQEER